MQRAKRKNNIQNTDTAHQLTCTLFTDPLCCWSWAMEPVIFELKQVLGSQAHWITKMGGLIPSWENYHDEANSVSRPAQMGPVWMHAAAVANKKINHLLWVKDPPASSYPACVAVKCAQLQSAHNGDTFLLLLRRAAMDEGKNIARPQVIFEVAEKLSIDNPLFDVSQFIIDYNGDVGSNAFKEDLQEIQYYRINRFPSILLSYKEGKSFLLQGFRTYDEVIKEILLIYPQIIL